MQPEQSVITVAQTLLGYSIKNTTTQKTGPVSENSTAGKTDCTN